ncbi:MAG TPA: DMT family transporter [Actinomycetota bacterium]|nr:DMT family transporter [Actinomycetota bacterium]
MIYGLAAALGWGLSDLWAAMSGRRIGSGRTVVISQIASAIVIGLILVVARPSLDRIPTVAGWLVVNAFLGAAAYATLYRALQLGPIAVVSPVLATYAIVPVLLAVVILGESLDALAAMGAAVTIGGAVLTSTDLRELRSETRTSVPGLPWAVVSTVLFGVATYVMGWSAQEAGFLPSLWFGRTAIAIVVVVAALVVWARSRKRGARGPDMTTRAIWFAAAVGVAELAGTIVYARGAEVGFVSIVTAASATYPLIPVLGGLHLLHERLAPSQYVGIALVVIGLATLGLAA